MSFAIDEGEVVAGADAVEGGDCRVGGGAVVVEVLA